MTHMEDINSGAVLLKLRIPLPDHRRNIRITPVDDDFMRECRLVPSNQAYMSVSRIELMQ